MLAYLLQGITLGFSAAMIPGAFQAYLLSQTLKNGLWRTLPAVLAPLISDGPIIVLVLFVLAQMPPWFINLLQIAGGLFVLYLAFVAFKTAGVAQEMPPETAQQNFLRAVIVNLLNPGPYIFWSTVTGPIFLEGWRQAASLGLGFVASFYVGLLGGLTMFMIVFAVASHAGPRVRRVLNGVAAVALLCFGLYQLWSGLAG